MRSELASTLFIVLSSKCCIFRRCCRPLVRIFQVRHVVSLHASGTVYRLQLHRQRGNYYLSMHQIFHYDCHNIMVNRIHKGSCRKPKLYASLVRLSNSIIPDCNAANISTNHLSNDISATVPTIPVVPRCRFFVKSTKTTYTVSIPLFLDLTLVTEIVIFTVRILDI